MARKRAFCTRTDHVEFQLFSTAVLEGYRKEIYQKMSINTIDTVFLTAMFILPGFLISGIIDAINPPKKEKEGFYYLRCLSYSIINCACLCWLYEIIMSSNFKNTAWNWIFLIISTVFGAVALAFIIALVKQRRILGRHRVVYYLEIKEWIGYFWTNGTTLFIVFTHNCG